MPAGGIVAVGSMKAVISYCLNVGPVKSGSANVNASAGGILGQDANGSVTTKFCDNVGDVTASQFSAGGIAMSLYGTAVTHCRNGGDVNGAVTAAGISAKPAYGNSSSSYCVVDAAVAGGTTTYRFSSVTPASGYDYDGDTLKTVSGTETTAADAVAALNAAANEAIDFWVVGEDGRVHTILMVPEDVVSRPTEAWVDDDYTAEACGGHVWGYDAFNVIQAGIDAVAAGGTVHVAAGVYNLASVLKIEKPLLLRGDLVSPSSVVINAPTAGGPLHGDNSGFMVLADDVTISGFRIQGALHTGVAQNAGIYIDSPKTPIHGIEGTTLSYNEITGNGYGIVAQDARNAVIAFNHVYANLKFVGKESESGVGIVLFGREEGADRTANVLVNNNTVEQNESEGIRIDVVSHVDGTPWVNDLGIVISTNSITANGSTIGSADKYLGVKSSGWSMGVSVIGNTLSGHTVAAPAENNQSAAIWIACSRDWDILDNTLEDNLHGVYLAYSTAHAGSGAYQIRGNTITNNVRGVSVDEVTKATVCGNSFEDNDAYGVSAPAESVGTLDATSNWWGSATGPANTANAGGTGAAVVGNVEFSPWLGLGTDTSDDIGFQPLLTPLYYLPVSITIPEGGADSVVVTIPNTNGLCFVRFYNGGGDRGYVTYRYTGEDTFTLLTGGLNAGSYDYEVFYTGSAVPEDYKPAPEAAGGQRPAVVVDGVPKVTIKPVSGLYYTIFAGAEDDSLTANANSVLATPADEQAGFFQIPVVPPSDPNGVKLFKIYASDEPFVLGDPAPAPEP